MKDTALAKATKEAMKKFNIRASKKYGQNFIIDEEAINTILKTASINEEDRVLEIGPGLGTLTRFLCEKAAKVLAVEIDKQIVSTLNVTMSDCKNFVLINDDFLRLNIRTLLKGDENDKKYKVVANLPYYITSPIIMKLLEEKDMVDSITLMVQKEVAHRICANPRGKEYGILSVAVQYHSVPKIIADVPAASFMPKPDVDSAIIHLKIREEPAVRVADEKLFFKVVRASFGQRRKTLLNSLYGSDLKLDKNMLKDILSNIEIDGTRRAETLSLNEFALITDEIGLFLNK